MLVLYILHILKYRRVVLATAPLKRAKKNPPFQEGKK